MKCAACGGYGWIAHEVDDDTALYGTIYRADTCGACKGIGQIGVLSDPTPADKRQSMWASTQEIQVETNRTCPFCEGQGKGRTLTSSWSDPQYSVMCEVCGCRTAWCETPGAAWVLWNNRPAPVRLFGTIETHPYHLSRTAREQEEAMRDFEARR